MSFLDDIGLRHLYSKLKPKLVRSAVQAEYDELEDKSGLYVITDAESSGSSKEEGIFFVEFQYKVESDGSEGYVCNRTFAEIEDALKQKKLIVAYVTGYSGNVGNVIACTSTIYYGEGWEPDTGIIRFRFEPYELFIEMINNIDGAINGAPFG